MSTHPLDLTGRAYLITGASAGLGRAIAEYVARLGARTILVARDQARLEEVRAGLAGAGHVTAAFDLFATEEIPAWMRDLAKAHGPLDGLVHSAGMLTTAPLRMLTAKDWERSFALNVSAAAALTKGFRQPNVRAAGGGSVVFLSSVMGLTGQPGQALYGATKGALISLARSLALELAREQIRVNCVAPAVVKAGMSDALQRSLPPEKFAQIEAMHPLGLGRPEDVAAAVAFLLADTARWITGTTLVADGGYTAH